MEEVKVIEAFLKPRIIGYGYGSGYGYGYGSGYGSGSGSGDGDGDGDGSGYGDGDGSGYGYGYGYGYGDGDGDGYGDGDGSGYGYGIKSINGESIWYIDDLPTIIDHVHSDYAIGRIVNGDLTTTPCYIARVGNSFAHGGTLKSAYTDAEAKAMEEMPLEERLAKFTAEFPSLQTMALCSAFYKWHHILTGSCTMGRDLFVRSHGLDMDKEYTVEYFLDIVKDSYGKEAIRQLRKMYEL